MPAEAPVMRTTRSPRSTATPIPPPPAPAASVDGAAQRSHELRRPVRTATFEETAHQGRADHHAVGHLAHLGRLVRRRDPHPDAYGHVRVAPDPLHHVARLVADGRPLPR